MKKLLLNHPLILALLLIMMTVQSCVPARKYQDAKTKIDRIERDLARCEDQLSSLKTENEQYSDELEVVRKQVRMLKEDTLNSGTQYRKIRQLNKDLNRLYDELMEKNKALLENTASEKTKLSLELNEKERELNQKEMELQEKELILSQKEKDITSLRTGLEEREERVEELESIIHRKDSIMNALQVRIEEALLGFKDEDLTVEMRDGKVYVSVSEQLLFKSGSITVDPEGKRALEKLGAVLMKNPDIEIMVEGHTDNVPIKTNCIKDNWDLSVLRATSIVRILQDQGVTPGRMLPCGRGEHFPVASNETKEGKAKNRRTEIILSPNLDELYGIFED